jgi:CheY-like chemotaxis protein
MFVELVPTPILANISTPMMNNSAPSVTAKLSRHTLILDDNDGNRMLLKFAMSLGKMSFDEATTGQEALDIWSKGKFAFAFLDIELPDISGLEVARRLRASDPNLTIIMCSTNDDPETITTAVKAGCDLFLVKPFQLDTLMTLVKVLVPGTLRRTTRILIIDNTARIRWENRP